MVTTATLFSVIDETEKGGRLKIGRDRSQTETETDDYNSCLNAVDSHVLNHEPKCD
jgi:hypothetical protein